MQGIQPQHLMNEEFLRQAYIQGATALSPEWVIDLLVRFENVMMENDLLRAQLDETDA